MQFLYYIPGQTVATPALIEQSGLAATLGEKGYAIVPLLDSISPDGANGLLLSRDTTAVFNADLQIWFPPADNRTYWLGMDRENPPTPDELKRESVIKGYDVKLADGNTWHIPTARRMSADRNDVCCLPMRYMLCGNGKPGVRILERYEKLWELSGELAQTVYGGGHAFTTAQAIEILACALELNYRVGYWETLALGLLSDGHMREVIDAIVDYQAFIEMLKKNAAGQKTDSGATD